MVFAMGNASMHRAGNMPVSLTFVTGVLVRFGQGLGDFLTRRSSEWKWLAQVVPWFGLIAGATAGSAAFARIEATAIWISVTLAVILLACSPLYASRIDRHSPMNRYAYHGLNRHAEPRVGGGGQAVPDLRRMS
jgi:uncharacterized membrane protein YoaK (UPF0700 family)